MTDKPAESSEPSSFEAFEQAINDGWVIPLLAYGKQKELAAEFNVSTRTIRDWKKRVDWTKARKEQQKRKDAVGIQVDDALERKAIAGDVRAIELYKQTVEGYVPLSGQVKADATDAELIARAAEIRKRLESAGPPGDGAGVGPNQPNPGASGTA